MLHFLFWHFVSGDKAKNTPKKKKRKEKKKGKGGGGREQRYGFSRVKLWHGLW